MSGAKSLENSQPVQPSQYRNNRPQLSTATSNTSKSDPSAANRLSANFTPDTLMNEQQPSPSVYNPGSSLMGSFDSQADDTYSNSIAYASRHEYMHPATNGANTEHTADHTYPVETAVVAPFNVRPTRGHRRNKMTISNMSDISVPVYSSFRQPLPAFTFGSSAVDIDSPNVVPGPTFKREDGTAYTANPVTNGERDLSTTSDSAIQFFPEFTEPPAEIEYVTRPPEPRRFSTSSTFTVASMSWNPFDSQTLELVYPHSLIHHSGMVDPNSTSPPVVNTDVTQMSWDEVREHYSLDSHLVADEEQGTRVHDFAYAAGAPPVHKHVRFASKSEHAPSAHHEWESEDEGLIDLGDFEPLAHSLSNLLLADLDNEVDIEISGSSTVVMSADVPQSHEQPSETKLKRSSRPLRKTSGSLSNFTGAHAGTTVARTPMSDNQAASSQAGSSNQVQDFQFPAPDPSHRNIITPASPTPVTETAKATKKATKNSFVLRLADQFGKCFGRR
ncbi:hypothetical protein T440DRAFT_514249 [Plenodomus tracheiphilus IPT5]|uniref:Uncharacterized protein n=1 Tax=Plenodomus tracheiphilus IPT5 TaxID=1408161 RepID=A0A6A7BM40_9PLEO|nr:hypothetical protein T440DRAFT_514249 [Plenodomus tracheiphilus IPT5]